MTSRYTPLSKVVAAAIIDTYGDVGRTYEVYSHWAARGFNKLVNEELDVENLKKNVYLPVNKNTKSAFLPIDFDSEFLVGANTDNGFVQIKPTFFQDTCAEIIDYNKCKRCKEGIDCSDGKITESFENIEINGTPYQKTITKTLYSNGELVIEETTPYLDTDGTTVLYNTTETRKSSFDLTDCGCIKDTVELQQTCPELYCGCVTTDYKYQILPEQGIIKLSDNFPYETVYVEYRGFLCKVNGEYAIPSIAFETLVEWTKYKAMQNKGTKYPLSERAWQKQNYITERKNLMKIQGKVFLSVIIDSLNAYPQFPLPKNTY